MTFLLQLVRLLLCLVFLIAGLGKLADVAGSQQALRDFGVPAQLSAPLGILLPLAELSVAVALIASFSAWWGALGALALLLLFISVIGANLAQGLQPDCHCFGQLHAAPGGLDWLAALSVSQRIVLVAGVVVLALLIGQGWLLWQVLRQQGRLLLRLEAVEARLAEADLLVPQSAPRTAGLPVDTPAPEFTLADLAGATISLAALRALGKPVVLVFSDPACGPSQRSCQQSVAFSGTMRRT